MWANRRSSWIGTLFLFISSSALLGCNGDILREDPYRQEVLRLVAAQPSDHVVDIGCQDGFWSYEFGREVGLEGRVYALDIEDKWVEHVREQSKKQGMSQVHAILCLPDDTTLEDESADVIFLANTIHHIDDIPAYTNHLYRILRPGGKYIVIDHSKGRLGHSAAPEEIRRIGADAGFIAGELRRFEGTRLYMMIFIKPVPTENPIRPLDSDLGDKD
jgi:ubiquinone/menaquinone biosynthesis C-methylase UbiE